MRAAAGEIPKKFLQQALKNYLQATEDDFYVIFGSISLWEHNLNAIAFSWARGSSGGGQMHLRLYFICNKYFPSSH